MLMNRRGNRLREFRSTPRGKGTALAFGVLSVLIASCLLGCAPSPPGAADTPGGFPARGSVGATGSLTVMNPPGGVLVIRQPTVLRNVLVHGGIDIYAPTELHNVYVQNDGRWWGNVVVRKGGSLLAEDCTIKPTATTPNPARSQDGVLQSAGGPVTIRRCDISGSGKGALLGDNATIEDSWLHDFTPYQDPATGAWTHKDAFMSMGGSHIRITRCRCETNNPTPYNATTNPGGFDPSSQTASILLQPWDAISDVVIEDSFLQGGYYALRMQSGAGAGVSTQNLTGLVVRNNVFGPAPKGGNNYTYDKAVQITQWSGNVTGDVNGNPTGAAVAKP